MASFPNHLPQNRTCAPHPGHPLFAVRAIPVALDGADPGLYERDPDSPRVSAPPADGEILTLRRSLSRRI
jgi:hypothetical protein